MFQITTFHPLFSKFEVSNRHRKFQRLNGLIQLDTMTCSLFIHSKIDIFFVALIFNIFLMKSGCLKTGGVKPHTCTRDIVSSYKSIVFWGQYPLDPNSKSPSKTEKNMPFRTKVEKL